MRILYITNKPMFPLLDGGCIASYTWMKNMLQLGFGVKYLTMETDKHAFDLEKFPEDLRQIVSPEAVFIDTAIRAKDAFLSLFNNKSYHISRFYSPAVEQAVVETLQQSEYGLVVLENAYTLPYLKAIRQHFKGKVIIRTHNVESRLWERLAQEEKGLVKRVFLKKLAKDLKNYEVQTLPKVDGIASISDDDLQQFRKLGIKVPIRTIPVSMDLSENAEIDFQVQSDNAHDFFFLGAMNWMPNIEALDHLLKEVFPAILEKMPEAKLHIAGSYMPEKLASMDHPNITVHGRVDNVKGFMASHGILIVPMKSGSGIRIKILEALSMGVPVISTSVGFEGIPVEQEIHGLIANTSAEMVEAAVKLSQDPAFAVQLGKRGQEMVLSTYSPENVSRKLLEFIESI